MLKENSCEANDSDDGDFSPSQDSSEDEETVEVNGFHVLPSQENLVSQMFKKHPDLTSNFDLKNQQLKNAYMDVLVDISETLSQSTKALSMEDLDKAESTLFDLTKAGLKVGWLRQKLDEAYLKKEKQRISGVRIRELEEQVNKRKLTLSDLESDLKKEKANQLSMAQLKKRKEKETRFSWVLKNFCSLQHNNCYSRTFVASDCNWRLLACYNKDRNGYLSLYLELADPASLPLGWRRQVNFRLTLVNKVHKQSTRVLEDLDDDDSSPVSDDEGQEICPLNQLNAWNKAFRSVGNRVEEYPDDDDASSLHQWKSMVYTSKTVENFGTECNNKESFYESWWISDFLETIDVNGFQVLASQVQSVSQIFKRHPDTAIGFRPKNQQIRKAYMDALLSLIETLCQSPDKLSDDDLSNADETLVDLIDVGFKLDWLKTKLNDVSEKKKLGESSVVRLETMEEQLQKLKHMVLDLESQMQKEKEKVLAARAPLSFKDILY
ncbi:unnamed protein product [Arabidopsis thaliana]|uniref:(thale cress) hypothetical protein n=1 Tax=Arabidopsis thaliana TaxID=3702 RepID=A0A7G2ETP3_ARATH|nr:unnamed protein product [Arabidopsis thaliana]